MLYGRQPDINDLRIFGSYALVNMPLTQRRKSRPIARRLRFVGFDPRSKYYRFIDNSNRVVHSQSANFEEDADWSRIHSNDPSVFVPRLHDSQDSQSSPISIDSPPSPDPIATTSTADVPIAISSSPESAAPSDGSHDDSDQGDVDSSASTPTPVLRRSQRTTRGIPPKRYLWPTTTKTPLPLINNLAIAPEHFHQLKDISVPEQNKWQLAMQTEMDSLKKLDVFTPAPAPKGKKVIGTRWVYKVKRLPNGESFYKARLVAQGYAQRFPDDYTDTYSPTVRTESVRIALTTASTLGLEVFQFDVETAYLHAHLDEEIYVKAAPGFQHQEGGVWLLNKSLYGLKQSGLMWYLTLSDKLNLMGFIKSDTDECVFIRRNASSYECVLVYVDDLIYLGPNKKTSEEFSAALQKHFTLKPLGHVNTFLGVHITKTQKGFALSQEDKIDQLVLTCRMENSHPRKIPLQTDFHKLTHEEGEPFENTTLYRSVIGSLLYIGSWTRPDISLSVNLLSRHVSNPTQFHWQCLKKLIAYLKHTKTLKLKLEPTHKDPARLVCFADSDWSSDLKTRKSTSGYMMFLNGCPIFWQVRKQRFICCSTTESEYACVSDACNSLLWFDSLITDIWTKPSSPITVMEDNESVVCISETRFTGSKSRHIDIRYQNVRKNVKEGFIQLEHVSTYEQLADMLTKPLPVTQHEYLREKMCLT